MRRWKQGDEEASDEEANDEKAIDEEACSCTGGSSTASRLGPCAAATTRTVMCSEATPRL